jgi:hypothetical protein
MMRTTLNIPDDVYDVVSSLASARHISLGEALAELVRRGLNPPLLFETEGDFPRFRVPKEAGPITLEKTLQVEDEL